MSAPLLTRLLGHRAVASVWQHLPQWAQAPLRRLAARRLASAQAAAEAAYEPELRSALDALVAPGSICADVGAHHGVLTRVLAERTGREGRVVAFEAFPDNARILRDRLSAYIPNPLRIENVAVTDGSQPRVALHPGRGHASTEWNIVGTDVDGRATAAELEVEATSLDDYFAARGMRVDLVKIDVEGAEADVLRGMRRMLKEDRPVLAVEFHNDAGWAGRRELLEAGYDLYTTAGTKVDPGPATPRLYHCLALPPERALPSSLAR